MNHRGLYRHFGFVGMHDRMMSTYYYLQQNWQTWTRTIFLFGGQFKALSDKSFGSLDFFSVHNKKFEQTQKIKQFALWFVPTFYWPMLR